MSAEAQWWKEKQKQYKCDPKPSIAFFNSYRCCKLFTGNTISITSLHNVLARQISFSYFIHRISSNVLEILDLLTTELLLLLGLSLRVTIRLLLHLRLHNRQLLVHLWRTMRLVLHLRCAWLWLVLHLRCTWLLLIHLWYTEWWWLPI